MSAEVQANIIQSQQRANNNFEKPVCSERVLAITLVVISVLSTLVGVVSILSSTGCLPLFGSLGNSGIIWGSIWTGISLSFLVVSLIALKKSKPSEPHDVGQNPVWRRDQLRKRILRKPHVKAIKHTVSLPSQKEFSQLFPSSQLTEKHQAAFARYTARQVCEMKRRNYLTALYYPLITPDQVAELDFSDQTLSLFLFPYQSTEKSIACWKALSAEQILQAKRTFYLKHCTQKQFLTLDFTQFEMYDLGSLCARDDLDVVIPLLGQSNIDCLLSEQVRGSWMKFLCKEQVEALPEAVFNQKVIFDLFLSAEAHRAFSFVSPDRVRKLFKEKTIVGIILLSPEQIRALEAGDIDTEETFKEHFTPGSRPHDWEPKFQHLRPAVVKTWVEKGWDSPWHCLLSKEHLKALDFTQLSEDQIKRIFPDGGDVESFKKNFECLAEDQKTYIKGLNLGRSYIA